MRDSPELLAEATCATVRRCAHSAFAPAAAAQYLKAGRMPTTLANVRKDLRQTRQGYGRSAYTRAG